MVYSHRNTYLFVLFSSLVVLGLGLWLIRSVSSNVQPVASSGEAAKLATLKAPNLQTQTVIEGLSNPWDVGFTPDGTALFTERGGQISKVAGGKKQVLATLPDVYAKGEGGLMGLVVDPNFQANHFIYACYDTSQDIRLSRWRVNDSLTALEKQTNIVTGLPVNTSTLPRRHSGCRPRFGTDGYLWIGTGDAAVGTNAQNPSGLGGKILRVDREGHPAPGNLAAPFDSRIFSYGHRNVQGLAFLPVARGNLVGYSIEHGPTSDDEVNELVKGNFGWDPVPGYNESVPMTDTAKYPQAIGAVWNSGSPTIAPSGATILTGKKWQLWEGALAMAVLKGQQVRVLLFGPDGHLKDQQTVLTQFGRLRSAVTGPHDELYLTSDNGNGQDKIIRVIPD